VGQVKRYQIVQNDHTQVAMFVEKLAEDEAEALEALGYRVVEEFTAKNDAAAKKRFVSWVHTFAPDASEQEVRRERLELMALKELSA